MLFRSQVRQYLTYELGKMMKNLGDGLKKLTLGDNFNSFTVTVTIGAGSELAIKNQLSPKIPSARLILKSTSFSLADGPTGWTTDFVYIKNYGGSPATATIIFME